MSSSREEQFHCDVCGKTFTMEKMYDYHMVVGHIETNECKVCDTKFKKKYFLANHMKDESCAWREFRNQM